MTKIAPTSVGMDTMEAVNAFDAKVGAERLLDLFFSQENASRIEYLF